MVNNQDELCKKQIFFYILWANIIQRCSLALVSGTHNNSFANATIKQIRFNFLPLALALIRGTRNNSCPCK